MHMLACLQTNDSQLAVSGHGPDLVAEVRIKIPPHIAELVDAKTVERRIACGVPVILTANTGVKDLIADRNSLPLTRQQPVRGYALSGTEGWGESDVEEIVQALERLYSDTALRRRIGDTGAAWIVGEGRTWSNHARQLKSLLLSL
jgi:glycosyltransferase involved in cell wall biosynthesis